MNKFQIYFEHQESQLCGQHCLNNLLQQPVFSAIDLADIASNLDQEEMRHLSNPKDMADFRSRGSTNVDLTGNFSFQVLNVALRTRFNIQLISWSGKEGRNVDITSQNAFLIHEKNHWYIIRKIRNQWWDLNSLLEKPSPLSMFYVTALLGQLREEGGIIFLIDGKLPDISKRDLRDEYMNQSCWFDEDSLLSSIASDITNKNLNSRNTFQAFQGNGNTLGSSSDSKIIIELDDDEDTILAKTLEISMKETKSTIPTAQDIRAKRLAALERK